MDDPREPERRYLDHLRNLMSTGDERTDRTGVGTLSTFGTQLRFDLRNHTAPLLTTKRIPWKSCIRELLWFLRGQTDAKILNSQGVKIWNGNSSRDFLDKRGLSHLPEGDIGAGYGFQFRHFGGTYKDCHTSYPPETGFDQVSYVLDLLRDDPTSRRMIISAWNPGSLSDMALPPCHMSCQFYVRAGRYLSCHMYQRSCDEFLGRPWNIFSYSVLTILLARWTGFDPETLVLSSGDCHIYKTHLDAVETQLSREPYDPPKIYLSDRVKPRQPGQSLDDLLDQLTIDDFIIEGYRHHDAISAEMAV